MSFDDVDEAAIERAAADLVAYFEKLPEAARRELQALAALDVRFGEDVGAEERAKSS